MRRMIFAFVIVLFVFANISICHAFDKAFLINEQSKGGTLLIDRVGNLHYLWIVSNRDELDFERPGDWDRLRYTLKYKKETFDGKPVIDGKSIIEIGPSYVGSHTNGKFDSQYTLLCFWNLCISSDVVSPTFLDNAPCYALLSKIDTLGITSMKPCSTLAFSGEMVMTVDSHDAVWAAGMPPGSQVFVLCMARLYPKPQKEYTQIYGGIWMNKSNEEVLRYKKTSTGRGIEAPGLKHKILGFAANNRGQFILCERMSRGGKDEFSDRLVSYNLDKDGNLVRDPADFSMMNVAIHEFLTSDLERSAKIPFSEIFTYGTRIVNYGDGRIFAIAYYDDRVFVIPLGEDGSPVNSGAPIRKKARNLPMEGEKSLRLWNSFIVGEENSYLYIFGIDEKGEFYWDEFLVK